MSQLNQPDQANQLNQPVNLEKFQLLDTVIYIGDDALDKLKTQLSTLKRVFILVDVNTLKKCLPQLEKILPEEIELHTLAITPGEQNKNIQTAILLWKQLMQLNVKRNDVLINLGGGMVSDIGAFVAATYKRGIDFINVPTTLLGMADAAIGGKAGVDFEDVKNQIGIFAHPQSVFIYPPFLETLEARQIRNGFAEIIKYSLIEKNNLWKQLQSFSFKELPNEKLIADAAKAKIEIVNKDPEEKGLRKILNYGHTIGHAFESLSLMHDKSPILHGEAIAAGMICEAWLSNQKTGLSQIDLKAICDLILKHFPKYIVPKQADEQLLEFMRQDKKNTQDKIQFSLLRAIGESKYNVSCSEQEIISALSFYRGLE